MADVFDLSVQECEQMLRSGVAARIAICTPSGPHIIPVNYSVVGDTLVVRTTPYSVLGTSARGSLLALETDQFDYENQRGWSVVARGRAEVVTDPGELDEIRSTWPPQPWASGSRSLFLRLRWSELSGRRLGKGWDIASGLPVRRTV